MHIEPELEDWAAQIWGGMPPPEMLEAAHKLACWLKDYMIDSDDFFGNAYPVDMVRIRIQYKLMELMCEAVRIDRQIEGPSFFGTKRQCLEPWRRRQIPPLRSWIRRNGK
jgi:hypothetical protein